MRSGKELILATKPFATEDRTRSWMYFLSTLLFLLLAMIASSLPFHPAIRLTFSLLVAFLLVRMFAIYHDYLHNAILKGSFVAKLLFTLYGYYTLNPSSIWKRSHDYHHKHNSKLFSSSIGSFPIYTIEQYNNLTSFERIKYLFIRHPLTILFGYVFAFWFGMCLLSLFRNPKKHWDSAMALVVHNAIGISFIVFGGWDIFLFTFILPAFISSSIGSYLFYAQHNFPGARFSTKEKWNYADAALHSTSYLKMNQVMHWFTGNIGYHHVHHMNALIPFYRLPEAHGNFPEFKVVKRTSFSLKEVFSCLRMKVWDPELNCMLGLKEIKISQMNRKA